LASRVHFLVFTPGHYEVIMLTESTHSGPSAVVLCVDDDAAMLRMVKMALECDGYTVLTAANGPAGLDAFCSQAVDAVVLDYEMPGMNGGEVAAAMKRLKPEVPKLLFTACPEIPADAANAVEAFCGKTNGVMELLSRVEAMIRKLPRAAAPLMSTLSFRGTLASTRTSAQPSPSAGAIGQVS